MKDAAIKFTFKIEDFTPETMPFGRLLEYYDEIAKMIGWAEHLHLLGVVEGSHGSTFAIDRNHETDVIKRLVSIKEGTAPRNALRAHSAINTMLSEDRTSGVFSDPAGQNVVVFPGRRADDSVQIRIRDAATFTGELYYIKGAKDDAKVRIKTKAYGVVFCTTTRDIARSLGDFLFDDVKVSGRGTWLRGENGSWDIDDFTITDFVEIKRENLRSAVDNLRAIDMKWPDDPLAEIRKLEEKNGPIQ